MDKSLDWALVQSFAAVAETGSLSAAARKLGQSQPTIGRHIKALEAQIGTELFTRVARGLEPTDAARSLMADAETMRTVAARLHLTAAGQKTDLSGTVRITASVVVSHFLLPPVLAAIRRADPAIQIELVPSDASENLLFRDADIAIRMYRPTQLDIIASHVADQPMGLYAATAFLDQTGRPQNTDDMMKMDFVGFDTNEVIIRVMRENGWDVDRNFFPIRCDDQAAYWHLVCAGGGIGGMQCAIGDAEPRVERVLPDFPLPDLPVWLAAPEALRHNPRIRRVWDLLSDALSA